MVKVEQLEYWSQLFTGKKNKNPLWQGFSPDTTDLEGGQIFIEKYGYKPEAYKRDDAVLLVGPILEDEK